MRIEWNKVTWYSVTLSIVVIGGFIAGVVSYISWYRSVSSRAEASYEALQQAVVAQTQQAQHIMTLSPGSLGTGIQSVDTSSWKVYTNTKYGFSFQYPSGLELKEGPVPDFPMWRYGSMVQGDRVVAVGVLESQYPKTNLGFAGFHVGVSADPKEVAACLSPDYPSEQMISTSLSGVPFEFTTTTDVGAGNYYDITSYRTVHAGTCFALEIVLHSSNIMNYSETLGMKEFDRASIYPLLLHTLQTFRFQ